MEKTYAAKERNTKKEDRMTIEIRTKKTDRAAADRETGEGNAAWKPWLPLQGELAAKPPEGFIR